MLKTPSDINRPPGREGLKRFVTANFIDGVLVPFEHSETMEATPVMDTEFDEQTLSDATLETIAETPAETPAEQIDGHNIAQVVQFMYDQPLLDANDGRIKICTRSLYHESALYSVLTKAALAINAGPVDTRTWFDGYDPESLRLLSGCMQTYHWDKLLNEGKDLQICKPVKSTLRASFIDEKKNYQTDFYASFVQHLLDEGHFGKTLALIYKFDMPDFYTFIMAAKLASLLAFVHCEGYPKHQLQRGIIARINAGVKFADWDVWGTEQYPQCSILASLNKY